MYYPTYDDYMRDIFYFNGLNNGMGYMNNPANTYNMGNNNLNNLYPSIYRIVYPVVQRVVSENGFQFANEDIVNNATNTIFDIVEGDISSTQNVSSTTLNNSQGNTQNQQSNSTNTSNNSTNSSTSNISSARVTNQPNNNNKLLKDLIRILVIRELLSKNNLRRFPNLQVGMPPYFSNAPIYNYQY